MVDLCVCMAVAGYCRSELFVSVCETNAENVTVAGSSSLGNPIGSGLSE